LSEEVVEWVADATGGTVAATGRVPGGATREAWCVDVAGRDGSPHPLIVRYSAARLPERSAFYPSR